jgi:hypothetical protein
VMPKAGNLGGLVMEHFDASSLEAFVSMLASTV